MQYDMVLTGGLQGRGINKEEIRKILKEEDKSEKILKIVQELQNKLEKQHLMLTKLVAMTSKMYQEGEMNKDTYNRLDQFLHDWLDSELKTS